LIEAVSSPLFQRQETDDAIAGNVVTEGIIAKWKESAAVWHQAISISADARIAQKDIRLQAIGSNGATRVVFNHDAVEKEFYRSYASGGHENAPLIGRYGAIRYCHFSSSTGRNVNARPVSAIESANKSFADVNLSPANDANTVSPFPQPSINTPWILTLSVAAALTLMPFVKQPVMLPSLPSDTIEMDFVIVTAPNPPGSRTLISPLGAVFEMAPAKVLQGAVREHGFASSPTPDTQVRVAWAYEPPLLTISNASAAIIKVGILDMVAPNLNDKRTTYRAIASAGHRLLRLTAAVLMG
jgi:hypothetical protein